MSIKRKQDKRYSVFHLAAMVHHEYSASIVCQSDEIQQAHQVDRFTEWRKKLSLSKNIGSKKLWNEIY